MTRDLSLTIWRTSVASCPACSEKRRHEASELKIHHPFSGHGFDRAQWSHPALDPQYLGKWAAAKAGSNAAMQAEVAGGR